AVHLAVLELEGEDVQVLVGSTVQERAAARAFADHQRALRGDRVHGHLRLAGLEHAAYRREKLVDDRILATMGPLTEDAFHLHLPDGFIVKRRADLLEVASTALIE